MQKKEMKLLLAAKANDSINVLKILTKIDKAKTKGKFRPYVDINSKNPDGQTALHYAAKHGSLEIIEELLSRGSSIDEVDKEGWRPLSYASANNHLDAASKLIDCGSKLNIAEEDNSPILIAARMGHRDIVKLLMERGADIHCQNKLHQTPVDVACENNHYGVVNVLLSASSKLIEEFSENSFRSIARKSLNPSAMRTTTLPNAISNGNIRENMFSNRTNNYPNTQEFKWCSIEAPEQTCFPDRYNLHQFTSHPAKKSESLSAIFQQDDGTTNNGSEIKSIKSNTLNNNTKRTPLEIVLPYPSRFSTSEVLKIKSPLLPQKSNQIKDPIYLYKRITKQSSYDDQHCDAKAADQKNFVSDETQYQRENIEHIPKFRNHYQSPRVANKTGRSSLPLQSHYRIMPGSPTQVFQPESRTDDRIINSKPPSLKYRETRVSQSDSKRKPRKSKEIFQENSSATGNRGASVINATCMNNDGISCQTWIKSIGLLIIWDSLVTEGFDSFLALSLATDEELLILCNNRIDHLDVLKTQLGSLSIPSIDQLMFSSDIQQILTQLGLEKYSSNFIREGYFYVGHLPNISEKLMNQLEIVKMGHRRLLFDCFKTLIRNRPMSRERSLGHRSASSLSQEITNAISVSPVDLFQAKDTRSKCNSLPRFSLYSTELMKRSPPPIPPRSCSILNDSCIQNFTLDDILTDSMCQENISPKKKDYCASSEMEGDLANLDDLVIMLTNLGRELDSELNHNA